MPSVHRSNDDGYQAIGRIFRRLEHRIEDLERKTKKAKRSSEVEVAPFAANGAVAVTTSGDEPQWNVQRGGQIVVASLHLKTAGSSSTVFTYYLNGASIGTATLASSATDIEVHLGSHRAKPGDKIGGRITTAGAGAKGLSAFVRMKG